MTAFGIFANLAAKGQPVPNPIDSNGAKAQGPTDQHEAVHKEANPPQAQTRDSFQPQKPQLKNIEATGSQSPSAKDSAYSRAHQRLREDVNSGAVDSKKTNLLHTFARYVVEERSKGSPVSKQPQAVPMKVSSELPRLAPQNVGSGGHAKPTSAPPKFSEGTVEVNDSNGNYTVVDNDENGEAVTFTYTPRDLGCVDDWKEV